MADDITFNLIGYDDLAKRLKKLSTHTLQKKIARYSARKAMNIVRDAARQRAREFDNSETPLQLYKFIHTAESGRRSTQVGGIVMRVGVWGGARISKEKKTPWYFGIIEFGKENQAANPFLRPALSENIQKVTDKFAAEMKNEINKII